MESIGDISKKSEANKVLNFSDLSSDGDLENELFVSPNDHQTERKRFVMCCIRIKKCSWGSDISN